MEPGTQIAYIPTHAKGDINHDDVDFGFVTSERKTTHFCRYWHKGSPGDLRTVSSSEATPSDMLVEHTSVSQSRVDALLQGIILQAERFLADLQAS